MTYFTVLCSILWKSLKQTIFACIFILCCYWFWLACVLLLALPFPWKPAVSVPLSVRTHAFISVSDLCGLYYHIAKLLRTRSYLEWAGFEAKLWQSFLRVTVQLGRGILWLVFWLPRRFCLLVSFDCTIGLRGPCVVAVVSSESPRSDCLECKTWNKRVSTCVSMFLSRTLRVERKDAMSSWNAEQTQSDQRFFFPSRDGSHAGSWAAAGRRPDFSPSYYFAPRKTAWQLS